MDEKRLAEIEARAGDAGKRWAEGCDVRASADDVPDLVAEVRRLRGALERLVHRAEHTAQTMQDHSHLWAAAKRARRVLEAE